MEVTLIVLLTVAGLCVGAIVYLNIKGILDDRKFKKDIEDILYPKDKDK